MKTYNTYQEAKIANPKSEIYVHGGKFLPECDILPSHETYERRGYFKCRPADYCMTLAEFLAKGHRGVDGDWYMMNGKVEQLPTFDVTTFNLPSDMDSEIYILRAKALEQAEIDTTPHQVESLVNVDSEWKNGDILQFIDDEGEWKSGGRYIAFDNHVSRHVIMTWDGLFHAGNDDIRKPETPQQRQEREELEAAYELYCTRCDAIEWENKYTFHEFQLEEESFKGWVAVVRKTKYRKQ